MEDYDREDTGQVSPARPDAYGDLMKRLQGWYRKDLVRVQKWRKQAREDFQFYAGDQWSQEDRNELAKKNRVPVVFNRLAPLVNAVVGSEINNRREVQYYPREVGDAVKNEILTAAAEWFRDQTGAEDEESDAFQDTVISGMGWTDTRLDFEEDPDGAPKIERIDGMEMVWDCNSTKANLADCARMFRVKEFPWAQAEELFPGVDKSLLNATWARSGVDTVDPHDQDRADLYEGEQDEFVEGVGYPGTCTIVEARWFEKQPFYRGPDIENPGQVKEYTEEQVSLLKKQYGSFPAVRQTRNVLRRAFIGKEVLAEPDQPLVPPGMFGWECITGYYDKAECIFYGIVKAAKDPQRWTNKFFSQVMFLLNSQAKGGIAAERDAFEDPRQAEESWAKSDEITWMKKGSLGQNPKLMPKAPAQFPAGFFTLFQESKDEVTQVTGLSPEFIGTREVTQAGVLEMQRRQSSLNLLASLFNSLRRYRKRQGKTMLYLIQNYLSDGRLVRIVGDDRAQYVPLTKEDASSAATYDIIVDDAPTSPNEKDKTWSILMELLPMVRDMMDPAMILEVLKYSPLPASMVEKLTQRARQQQEQAAQQPDPAQQAMQMELQAKAQEQEIEMAGKAADLQVKQKSAEIDMASKMLDLFVKQKQAQDKLALDAQKLELDQHRLAVQAASNAISRQNANARQTSAAK